MHPTQPIPGGDESNPYDFILNGPPKQKRPIIPKGESKQQRIIIMAVIGLAVLTVLILVFSLIFSVGGSGLKNLENIAKQQQEIIRISAIGEREARSSDTLNLAVSTKFALTTSQQQVLAYLDNKNVEVKDKQLNELRDSSVDEKLQIAKDSGTFDEVFTTTLINQLNTYRSSLSTAYDQTGSQPMKNLLSEAYDQTNALVNAPETQ